MIKIRSGKAKHKLTWFWLIIVTFMIGIIAGCGGDSSSSATEKEEDGESAVETDSTTETEDREEETAVDVDEKVDEVEEVKLTPQEEMIGRLSN